MTAERDADLSARESLEALVNTPVGRRWLLKAGLGSAASLALGSWAAPRARAAARAGKAVVPLQFALGPTADLEELTLVAGGASHPLLAHGAASRRALAASGGLWGKLDGAALTHYVEAVELPVDRAQVVSVVGRRRGRKVVVAQLWHVPQEATLALARAAVRIRPAALASAVGSDAHVAALGIRAADVASPEEFVHLASVMTSQTTAVTIVSRHPNVATIDPTSAAITKSLLSDTNQVTALGTTIASMQRDGEDAMKYSRLTNPDGSPTVLTIGGQTVMAETIRLSSEARFRDHAKSALTAGIRGVRADPRLGAVIDKPLDEYGKAATAGNTWIQSRGVTPTPRRYEPARARAPKAHAAADTGLQIKVKSNGFSFGTRTEVTGPYDKGRVPLRLYNNYVRWLSVYVQYLGKDGENLSANPNPTAANTKYCESLGVLPQVFTVLGVPIWDTNTIEAELRFPEGAHTARILYCGLGSNLLDGGWRQYFPDDAYPDRIAPTDEVLFPALMTGILTIGLNAFAVVTDLNIALAWAGIKDDVVGAFRTFAIFGAPNKLELLGNGALAATAAEATAATVAEGTATYRTLEGNGYSVENLWRLLLELAGLIPKVLFTPSGATIKLWSRAGAVLAELIGATAAANAIPFIGQVLAVLNLAGDVATLAEVCTEVTVSPWVVENEVTLTYEVMVTIEHDPRAATFPATATHWRLDVMIDGASSTDPITGELGQDGKLRSEPLKLALTAPFGGKQIQWSVVFLDSRERQVATGVSESYVNDDPQHVASDVSLAIEQLPAVIDAQTVFRRAATTVYSTAAGGYTWADQVAVAGTRDSRKLQQVLSTAIATRLGVAGIVWKEKDKYWLRGVPIAQDDATITFGKVHKQGYVRRPFLLFDSFVGDADKGNQVLVEPDEDTDGYHIRRLRIDPKTGALDWDSGTSLGFFVLPVSAAALHSSGAVVALNTDTGRVGWLQPVKTERPPLAAYTGGPARPGVAAQIGLLSSPVALAVTNPGVVLVLEAGGTQLSAFDLNGNPVAYFGAAKKDLALKLDASKTYLDVAVDGADQIYLLSYTGAGRAVDDYRVDVHNADGSTLDTASAGVNVPHIAVDYWRSIYAANYDPLTDLGTDTPHVDTALNVVEPSLSRFDPS